MGRENTMNRMMVSTAVLALATFAWGDAVNWPFSVDTGGEDTDHYSKTTIDPNAGQYDWNWLITYVGVDVSWNGVPLGEIDVTDLIPPDLISGDGSSPGPAPTVLSNLPIEADGDGDGSIDIAANLLMDILAKGQGHLGVTDVYLGSVWVDLGWPIGVVEVEITRIYVSGHIDVVTATPPCEGDINTDGTVDVNDLLTVIAAWGPCKGCAEDVDANGVVEVNDLLAIIAAWGPCP